MSLYPLLTTSLLIYELSDNICDSERCSDDVFDDFENLLNHREVEHGFMGGINLFDESIKEEKEKEARRKSLSETPVDAKANPLPSECYMSWEDQCEFARQLGVELDEPFLRYPDEWQYYFCQENTASCPPPALDEKEYVENSNG